MKLKKHIHFPLYLLLGLMVWNFASCKKAIDDHYKAKNDAYNNGVWNLIKDEPTYSEFVNLVQRVNLQDQITVNSTVTLFIPTNEAIAAASLSAMSDSVLKRTLQFHICASSIPLNSLKDTIHAKTILGKYLLITHNGNDNYIGDSKIVESNIPAKNGVVHRIDKVLLPKISIFEFLQQNKSQYSRMYNYITSKNIVKSDLGHSIKIGFNSKGQTIYDTAFIRSNILLKAVGDFYSESAVLTTNFVSDDLFTKALQEQVYPYLTNTTVTNDLETYLFNRLIDTLIVRNTFVQEVHYTPGKNTLLRSKTDSMYVTIPNLAYGKLKVYYNKPVEVNADLLSTANICSNGLVYTYNSVEIPKKWFSYPFGRASYTYNSANTDSLPFLTPLSSVGTIKAYTQAGATPPVVTNFLNTGVRENYGTLYMVRQSGWPYLVLSDTIGGYIEYTMEGILPMRYKLVMECDTNFATKIQVSYTFTNSNAAQTIPFTNIGTTYINRALANGDYTFGVPDNTLPTTLPANYGRWVRQLDFANAGTVKVRFTLVPGTPWYKGKYARRNNVGVNVDLVYFSPID